MKYKENPRLCVPKKFKWLQRMAINMLHAEGFILPWLVDFPCSLVDSFCPRDVWLKGCIYTHGIAITALFFFATWLQAQIPTMWWIGVRWSLGQSFWTTWRQSVAWLNCFRLQYFSTIFRQSVLFYKSACIFFLNGYDTLLSLRDKRDVRMILHVLYTDKAYSDYPSLCAEMFGRWELKMDKRYTFV